MVPFNAALCRHGIAPVMDDNIQFYPQKYKNTYRHWLENIKDWCISRQLWWGHRIPAWYHKETGEVYVDVNPPKDIENYVQDEDVLDTWILQLYSHSQH